MESTRFFRIYQKLELLSIETLILIYTSLLNDLNKEGYYNKDNDISNASKDEIINSIMTELEVLSDDKIMKFEELLNNTNIEDITKMIMHSLTGTKNTTEYDDLVTKNTYKEYLNNGKEKENSL